MRNATLFILLFLLVYSGEINSQTVPENLTLKEIFHEPVIPGIRPSARQLNLEQTRLYFTWNDSSYYETGLYSTDLDGNFDVVKEEETPPLRSVSPDGTQLAYVEDGAIYISDLDGSNPLKIVSTREREFGLNWSPDNQKIAFVRDGDVWVSYTDRPGIIQVTGKGDRDPSFIIAGWVGSDRLLLRQTDFSDALTVYFPDYLGDMVTPGANRRGIPKTTLFAASMDTTALDTLISGVNRSSTTTSALGRYAAIDYSDAALKHRKLIVHDLVEGTENVVFEDSTQGWLHHTYSDFAPESNRILFLSEQSGWNHLYTVNADGSELTQHTHGDFYVPWARWADDHNIIFASNEMDYGVRDLFLLNVDDQVIQKLTSTEAYRYQYQLSPDRSMVIYAKTHFNRPYELFKMELQAPFEEVQLTKSVPDRFHEYSWQEEEYIRFTGRDGETGLSMSVLYPQNFNPENSYPVVVFAHGAGSLQNVYKGWSNNYWREYMFHQYLLLHGYIVVEVDFRHSTGYGRKFREDVTNWMGKYETQDIVDGLDWAQEQCNGCLDLDNVGIYGGSYGGFMALYALTDKPDRFHAAAALRKVTNWRNYYYANPWYTLPRLGDPDEVPEHYDRSSPLTYASELTRPALLLHGLIDDNVGAQDAFQYIEELIQSGNEEFELMIYPSERHGFTSPNSWYDEYRRIFNFFEKHLK